MTVELMAPAGNWESLTAVLAAGADSVYFGAGHLNMRSRAAQNFALEDIQEVVKRCHQKEAKAYLTLNIIVCDDELKLVKALCEVAKKTGVDALIVSDPAVMMTALETGLKVHMSVQANICNLESVRFYARYADVMVLARELSLDRISAIVQGIRQKDIRGPSGDLIRVEIFAHGALCVAYSGKCNMSLAVYGAEASANRGACNQPCRRRYRVSDDESGIEFVTEGHPVMSPRDLCTLPFLDKILDSGVSVLKLEGRGRSPDYASVVTKVYRSGIEAYEKGCFAQFDIEKARAELASVFNRGFWEGGYYLGKPLGEWCESGGSLSTEEKVLVGEISKYYAKISVGEVIVRSEGFMRGDDLYVIGQTTGVLRLTVNDIHVGDDCLLREEARPGDVAAFKVPDRVREGDKVYRIKCRGQ